MAKAKDTTLDEAERLRLEFEERHGHAAGTADAPRRVVVPPPPLPETGEALLARLKVRQEGEADAPAWVAPPQRLTITERDGKVSTFETGEDGIYLAVEWQQRDPRTPWLAEQAVSRFGLASIASLELVDVDPEAAV